MRETFGGNRMSGISAERIGQRGDDEGVSLLSQHLLDPLLIDLNLRLMSGQAARRALEASYEEAGLLVDDAGRVTLLRLP